MKKLLFMTMLALGASIGHAQYYGFRGGFNLSNIGADAENNSMRPGFHIGAYYQVTLSDKILFEPELQLSLQGSNSDDDTIDQSITMLNVPLLAKYLVTDELSINAGPYLGLIMGAEIKSDADDIDNKDFFNSLDFGLGLGASYELPSGINLSVRYLMGLADITDDEGGTETVIIDNFPVEIEVEEQRITNQVIQFSVGYLINK
ncbi:MAG: porin family protein [Bacteroidota bacterium]